MNIGKIANGAVGAVKRNPELALAILGLLAPKLATKVVQAVAVANAMKNQPAG